VDEQSAFTFAQAAELYITAHAAGWKHERQEQQWRRSLELHAEAFSRSLNLVTRTPKKGSMHSLT